MVPVSFWNHTQCLKSLHTIDSGCNLYCINLPFLVAKMAPLGERHCLYKLWKRDSINFHKWLKEILKMRIAKNFKHISKLMKLSWILKRLRLGRLYIYACTASKFKLICGDPKGRVIIGFHFNFPGLNATCCVDSGWMSRQKTRKYLPFFTRTVF